MIRCHLCKSQSVIGLLDCGPQPICNRYLWHPAGVEYTHPMFLGQCQLCGLIQINDPVPAEELLPRHDWITYVEPEAHLDRLADIIAGLPGLTKSSPVCGLTYKDDSIVARLARLGFNETRRIDPEGDLGITASAAGDETIQDRLTPEAAKLITEKHGKTDVVIGRHIFEHAHQPLNFLKALKRLVSPKGYIVLEAPDTARSLGQGDYSCPWEEHTLYFTPETFQNAFAFGGLSVFRFDQFRYPDEDILTGITQVADEESPTFPAPHVLDNEISRGRAYAEGLTIQRARTEKFFADYLANTGKVALFGAGHRTTTYLELLNLKNYVEFVVDDNPNKVGLYMPGSRLPILGRRALISENIKLCIIALKSENEEKVILNNQEFLDGGGVFSSITPASNLALRV